MKKLFALLLALCLMWSVACAEESTMNWEDVEALIEASGLEGDFWNLEDLGLDIWLPNDLGGPALRVVEEVELIHMNGLDAVVYKDAGNDLWSATLVDTNSNLINFIMGPASEEGCKDVFAIIIASLQPED